MANVKEKAKELINKYLRVEDDTFFYWNCYDDTVMKDKEVLNHAKKCALITVDEIIAKHYDDWDEQSEYWIEVKQEIKNYDTTINKTSNT